MKQNATVQEDPMGCGVACASFITNKTYRATLKLFEKPDYSKTRGFCCKEIVRVLRQANLSYKYKYINNSKIKKMIYKNNTIVYLRRSKKYPAGHYLCRWNGLWMDSWINFPDENKKAGFRKRLPQKPIYVIYQEIQNLFY